VSYYRWITKEKPIFKIKFNEKLAKQIKDIYKFYNGIYGYLSVIKDIITGFIVSYILSKNNDTKIYKDTLDLDEKFRNKQKKQ